MLENPRLDIRESRKERPILDAGSWIEAIVKDGIFQLPASSL